MCTLAQIFILSVYGSLEELKSLANKQSCQDLCASQDMSAPGSFEDWLRWVMLSLQVCSCPAGDVLVCCGDLLLVQSVLSSGADQDVLPGGVTCPITLRC